jgi:hypothetical protein
MDGELPGARRVYRPAAGLRIVSGALFLVSLAVWLTVLFTWPLHRSLARAAAATILVLPCLAGAALLSRRIETDDFHLTSVSLGRAKRLRWSDVRRVDVRRGSFVIESTQGPVSAAMIAPGEREPLLRTVIERAGLTRAGDDLPWGIEARYVPRAQDIGFADFVPHNKRRRPSDPGTQ